MATQQIINFQTDLFQKAQNDETAKDSRRIVRKTKEKGDAKRKSPDRKLLGT